MPDVKLKHADSSMSFERVAVLNRQRSEVSVVRAAMFCIESATLIFLAYSFLIFSEIVSVSFSIAS